MVAWSPGLLHQGFWCRNASLPCPTPGSLICSQEITSLLVQMIKHKPRQSPCSRGAMPQQDLAHAMGHTALRGARYYQAMAISTSTLRAMGKVLFLASFTPNWPQKETSQADWASSKHGPAQLRELYIPLLPRAAVSALDSALAREEGCAAGSALPNHTVNCFAAACES